MHRVCIKGFTCCSYRYFGLECRIALRKPIKHSCNIFTGSVRILASTCVKTYSGKCCALPFVFHGVAVSRCLTDPKNNRPWCATTPNFDKEKRWGYCQPSGESLNMWRSHATPTDLGPGHVVLIPGRKKIKGCDGDVINTFVILAFRSTYRENCAGHSKLPSRFLSPNPAIFRSMRGDL